MPVSAVVKEIPEIIISVLQIYRIYLQSYLNALKYCIFAFNFDISCLSFCHPCVLRFNLRRCFSSIFFSISPPRAPFKIGVSGISPMLLVRFPPLLMKWKQRRLQEKHCHFSAAVSAWAPGKSDAGVAQANLWDHCSEGRKD